MAAKKPFYKRVGFIVLIALLLVVSGILIAVSLKFNQIVEDSLRAALSKNPNSTYQLDFKKIRVGVLSGNISMIDIEIKPRQHVLDSLNDIGIHQTLLANLTVKKFQLKQIDLEKLIASQDITVDKIQINKPVILLQFTGYRKEAKDTIDPREALHEIAKRIHEFSVNVIEINKADISVLSQKQDNKEIARIDDLTLIFSDFKLNQSKPGIPIDLSQATVDIKSIVVDAHKDFTIQIDGLEGSFRDSSMSLASFRYTPRLDKKTFSEQLKYEKAWVAVESKQIDFHGIDIDDFIFKNVLQVNTIAVNDLLITAYKDKTPEWPAHLKHKIPSAILKNLDLKFAVAQLEVNHSNLNFELLESPDKDVAKLDLNDMNFVFSNVTNIDSLLKENKFISAKGNMKLMNHGLTQINLNFDMSSSVNAWSIYAVIGKMDFATLNPIIFPLTHVQIKKGELISADIKMNCTNKQAKGNVELQYQNAEIFIMRMNKETNTLEGKKLLSKVINAVVRADNIKGSSDFRIGNIDYTRTPDQPFIKFLWNGIQSGMIDTFIGLGNKEKNQKSKRKKKRGKNR